MKMRIAILAACASTLVMTATLAHAGGPIRGNSVGHNHAPNIKSKQTRTAYAGSNRHQAGKQTGASNGSSHSMIFDRGMDGTLTSY